MGLFNLGDVDITPAATAALAAVGANAADFLDRHQHGDWGEMDQGNREENEFALAHPQAIYAIASLYKLDDGAEVLIITAADRSCTRMLLPSEEQVREVSTQEGYAVWAAGYDRESNPLIAAEEPLVDTLLAELSIASALDVCTGTGRYALKLARRGAAVAAIDQSEEMLAVARHAAQSEGLAIDLAQGSIENGLPYASGEFDLVTCALALCHVPNLGGAVAEMSRVLRPGGHLLITDFHPDVVAEGWRTTYERPGIAYLLPNVTHTRAGYVDAVTRTGCRLVRTIDIPVRDVPEGHFSAAMLRNVGDKPFGLIMLAQKPSGDGGTNR